VAVLLVSVAVTLGTPAAVLVAARHDPAPPSVGSRAAATPVRANVASPARVIRARPAALIIPSIGVATSVLEAGVTASGGVAVPDDIALTGWYRYGAQPSDGRGSTVLVGHRDGRVQGAGAFFRVGELRPGDRVTVVDTQWRRWTYQVVARESFRKSAVPYADLFAQNGPPRLTLISCGGRFLKDKGSYEDNVVVTAVPVRASAT